MDLVWPPAGRELDPGEQILLTVDEAARLMALGRSSVYRLIRAGKMPGIVRPTENSIRIHRRTLERWLEGAVEVIAEERMAS